MIFHATRLSGVFVIEVEPRPDERGMFARTYCRDEFARHGLCTEWVQTNVAFNTRAGTLRGMHWQAAPHAEAKLVRCVSGAAYDVVVDLRAGSPTRRQWIAVELTAANRKAVYVPEGFAHGYQTLADGTEMFYMMSAFHAPDAARGARWDDPALGIVWPPCAARVISPRDAAYPDLPT
jgi:dTDP-4-dehydrorhamnose 3,5-epimerase